MFSDRCMRIMSLVCFIVVNCGSSCVLYNVKTGNAYVTKIGIIRTILCMTILTVSATIGTVRTIYVHKNPTDLNKLSFPICCIFTMILIIACICSFITFIWLDEFEESVQQIFRFAERFKRKIVF